MADSNITGLIAGAAVGATDEFPAWQVSTVKITAAQIKTFTSASPTLVTPTIGVATATSINKVAITAPATSATLAIADGITLTCNASVTIAAQPPILGANTFTALQTGNAGFLAAVTDVTPGIFFTNNTTGPALRANGNALEVVNGSNNAFRQLKGDSFVSSNLGFYVSTNVRVGGGAGSDVIALLNATNYAQAGIGAITLYGTSQTTADTGLTRKAAKIVEINSGASGTYAGCALNIGTQTVAQLTAAATAGAGALAFVSDATATTPRSTVAGGGANKVLVMSDATNWLIVA